MRSFEALALRVALTLHCGAKKNLACIFVMNDHGMRTTWEVDRILTQLFSLLEIVLQDWFSTVVDKFGREAVDRWLNKA